MTIAEKKRLRDAFFKMVGPNAATFKALFDAAPELCFYMKDIDGRIMALNRRNCEVCNIRDEWDAIGMRSIDLFPRSFAEDYMALDREVLETGRPVLKRITAYPADNSRRLMVSDVYPLLDKSGQVIGTARAYRLTTDSEAEAVRYNHLRSVADFIQAHLAEHLTVERIAESANMSVSLFRRTFSTAFGMTPSRYILVTRLNAARTLLESTDKLITEIAQECGFFDQSHFTKAFLRERGITPGEYRRRHQLDAVSFPKAKRTGKKSGRRGVQHERPRPGALDNG